MAWARALPPAIGTPILLSLGIMVVAAPEAASTTVAAAPAVVEAALAALAEELDVGPRTLRRAVDRFLAALADGGVGIADARRRLAAPALALAEAKKR
jgi:hypothetical protein